jgi:hypothetical protein
MVHPPTGVFVRCWFHCDPPALPGAGDDPSAAALLRLMGSAPNERLVLESWQETPITVEVWCSDP